MKKLILAATALALSTTATAQNVQERLEARYDRALAAGYKALMLCSAISSAEAAGATRSEEHVTQMELTGIYPALDPIIRTLEHRIVYDDIGLIDRVEVEWAPDANARIADHTPGSGCSALPIGSGAVADKTRPPIRAMPIRVWSVKENSPVSSELAAAFDGTFGEGTRTTGVMVTQGGEWVDWKFAEGYSPYTPQRTWSVAKSIAATIVGAAVHRGEASASASAGLGEGTSDPRAAITIDHALRMASGRYSDTAGNRTDPLYWGGTTVDERAQNWPLVHAPGTRYRYANIDTLAAVQAIENTFETHTPAFLFALLGMSDTYAETDWQGNYVLSSQVWSSTSDLAKLGQLYLDNGIVNGRRIIPADWRDYVSDPSGPQPQGTQWGYGAGWWTFRRPEGNAFEGIPDDAFAARGNRGQYIVVVPSRDVVIVRRGEDMVGTRFDIAAFTRDVLAALED